MRHPVSPKLFCTDSLTAARNHLLAVPSPHVLFLFAVLSFLFLPAHAMAQGCPDAPGCLDQTFGSNGVSSVTVASGSSHAGVMDPTGRIIILLGTGLNGELVRFNADGSPDETFGGDGLVNFAWADGGVQFAVALQTVIVGDVAEERILVAGSDHIKVGRKSSLALRVDRFLPDGTKDTTFGANGTALFNTGYAIALAVQPDGKIMTVGDANKLVRMNADGKSLDSQFGVGGVVDTANFIRGIALAIQPDGRIIVGGSNLIKNKTLMSVARYDSNGARDLSFGTSGRTNVAFFGDYARAFNVAVGPGGTIVASGNDRAGDFATHDLAILRLTPGGQPDAEFGSGGRVWNDFAGNADYGYGLAIQSDGRILAGGHSTISAGNADVSIARFDLNGSLDASFGTGGEVLSQVFPDSRSEYGRDIFIQFDPGCFCEKIVQAGFAYSSTGNAAAVVRYIKSSVSVP